MRRRFTIGLAVVAVVVGAGILGVYLWPNGGLVHSVDSGDGWNLTDSDVAFAHIPGSVERLESHDGLGLRFFVATSSGGDADCYPPRLVGSTRTDSTLTLDFVWQQRGCADKGGEAFDLVVQDVPDGGLAVVFPVTPEFECDGAVLYPDGSVAGCRPRR